AMAMEKQAMQAGLNVRYERVTALSLKGEVKRVVTEEEILEAKAVILAMGAQSRRLSVPGEDELSGRGVSWCATCDGALFRGKIVAVIGGGNAAVEEALYLSALCSQVHLIHRRDEFRAERVLGERAKANPNINIHWDSVVEAFEGQNRLENLRLKNVRTGQIQALPASGAFVAIGKLPDTALVADQLPLNETGYVVAGEDTRTGLRGVYAAGDLRVKPLRQVATAVADGAVAATMALQDL
ncbi:MAG TPA: FAD-dependent oxidoreductase, partial [Clostridia bacterium]|nr:FAD-dependent oxidoreductase [Clostridia bacterium]